MGVPCYKKISGKEVNRMEKIKYKKTKKLDTKTLVILAVLVAIHVVLSRLVSIQLWNEKRYSVAFISIYVAAYLFGPIYAGIMGAVSDIIGALCFPTGPYFPGFTLTTFLTGVIFGLLLSDREKMNWKYVLKTVVAVLINEWILGWLINSLWISILYGSPYIGLLAGRAIQEAIMTAVQIAVILVMKKIMKRIKI